MSNTEPTIHNRVAVLRAEKGLTRQELADQLGVNYQTIGFLERGDYSPSLGLALDLAEFFHLPVETIFSHKPFRPLKELMRDAVIAEARENIPPPTPVKRKRA